MWSLGEEEFYPKVCGHFLFPFIISTGSLSFGKESWGSCWNLLKNQRPSLLASCFPEERKNIILE